MLKRILLAAAISSGISTGAVAQSIDFESETTGNKPNGYTIGGVSFYDTLGADLSVGTYPESNGTKGLAVFGDDTSALRMLFATLTTDLSLSFGNDEVCVPGNCLYGADRAYLEILLGGTVVGSTYVLFNQNNIADQSIGISGIVFNEARLTYTNSSFQAGNLIEVVDNISFRAAVPEPATWAMMLVGFGGIGFAMRRQRKAPQLAQVA